MPSDGCDTRFRNGAASSPARCNARDTGSRMRVSMAWTGTGRPARQPGVAEPDDTVRLLAPFDPVVWDRRRFELLWNWAYRFEAYTPVPKRRWGYYALPLLWREGVIGWANASVAGRRLDARCRLRRREAATRSSIPPGTCGRARSPVRVSRPRRLTRFLSYWSPPRTDVMRRVLNPSQCMRPT